MVSSRVEDTGSHQALPILTVTSTGGSLDRGTIEQLERLLPEYIRGRRWYRTKTRSIEGVKIGSAFPLPDSRAYILITQLQYADGGSDDYVVTVLFGDAETGKTPDAEGQLIATFRSGSGEEGNVADALFDPGFRKQLLQAFASQEQLTSNGSHLSFSQTSAFTDVDHGADESLESKVSRAEQSNSSIIYGDKYILKLFRKIEAGVNPDIEIGAFLTERGFSHTPSVLGRLEYKAGNDGQPHAAGILQSFVRNQGDAWKYTLDSLSGYFDRGLRSAQIPGLPDGHLTHLMTQPVPRQVEQLLGDYASAARLLGIRTAQMHAALSDPNGGPDFAPETFSSAIGEGLYTEMVGQADIAFELLRRKQAVLEGKTADTARELLRLEHQVIEKFSPLRSEPITAVRIRFHGDYHLGQVLYTGTDFMIIDFEGEPARPLEQRRSKGLAIRDVAGMVRSFQYAAFAALFGQVPGLSFSEGDVGKVEQLARIWFTWASAIYLNGYFEGANNSEFVSADLAERRTLLDAFLLHKALYEVAYELNNRPDWVQIPLGGILSLIH